MEVIEKSEFDALLQIINEKELIQIPPGIAQKINTYLKLTIKQNETSSNVWNTIEDYIDINLEKEYIDTLQLQVKEKDVEINKLQTELSLLRSQDQTAFKDDPIKQEIPNSEENQCKNIDTANKNIDTVNTESDDDTEFDDTEFD